MKRLVLFLCLICVPAFAAGVDGDRLSDPALEARAQTVFHTLRCLVCQNQSIAESDADLARDLRTLVRERIAAGDSDDEIRAFLVDRYGDWVLLEPPIKDSTAILWFGPLVIVLLGGAGLVLAMRRRAPAKPMADLTAEERAEIARLLDDRDRT